MSPTIQLICLVAGTIIPTIVGLITSRDCTEIVQTTIGATLSVVVGIVSVWSYTGQLNWVTAGIAVMTTFISTATLTHAVYRPSGATKKLQGLTSINLGAKIGA